MEMSLDKARRACERGQEQVTALRGALGDLLLSCIDMSSGLLGQFWLLGIGAHGTSFMHTKDTPFALLGSGDMLALYRCYSCRYKFTVDFSSPETMGAIGRVMATGEPEMTHNVQGYDKSTYGRVEDARRCSIYSTMVIPVYEIEARDAEDASSPFAVLEVMSMERQLSFTDVFQRMSEALQKNSLRTCDPNTTVMHMGLRLAKDLSSPSLNQDSSPPPTDVAQRSLMDSGEDAGRRKALCMAESLGMAGGGEARAKETRQRSWKVHLGEDGALDMVDTATDGSTHGGLLWKAIKNSSSRKRALPGVHDEGGADGDNAEEKESGYVGKRLMMQDLEPHFHLGLKEAAAELGVAPTTLKRVCRRLGIPRWPRRTLQKLSKQGDAANAVAVALGKRKEAPVVAQAEPDTLPGAHEVQQFRTDVRTRVVPLDPPPQSVPFVGTLLPASSETPVPDAAHGPPGPAAERSPDALPPLVSNLFAGDEPPSLHDVDLGPWVGAASDVASFIDQDFVTEFLRDLKNFRS